MDTQFLERFEETITPAAADLWCKESGCEKVRIGEEVTEVLERRPDPYFVRRIIRPQKRIIRGGSAYCDDTSIQYSCKTNQVQRIEVRCNCIAMAARRRLSAKINCEPHELMPQKIAAELLKAKA